MADIGHNKRLVEVDFQELEKSLGEIDNAKKNADEAKNNHAQVVKAILEKNDWHAGRC